MDWGALGGGVADIGGKAISSAIDYGFGQLAAKQQQRAQKELFRKRWRWTTSDMRRSGINPILATKAGPGAAPSMALGSTSGAPIQMGASAQRYAETQRSIAMSDQAQAQAAELRGRTRNPGMQHLLDSSSLRVNNAHTFGLYASAEQALSQAELNDETAIKVMTERIGLKEEREIRRMVAESLGDGFYSLNNDLKEKYGTDWMKWIIAASMIIPSARFGIWATRAAIRLGLTGHAKTLFLQAASLAAKGLGKRSNLQATLGTNASRAMARMPITWQKIGK